MTRREIPIETTREHPDQFRGVFICYRRDVHNGYAARLARDLRHYLSNDQIFRDQDDVDAGIDMTVAVSTALTGASALIALIGPDWLSASEKETSDREFSEVISQIDTAISSGIRVLPVLVGGATCPPTGALPSALHALVSLKAIVLRDNCWHQDVTHLGEALLRIRGITLRQSLSPEKARLKLGRMRIEFRHDDFLNRVANADHDVVALYIRAGIDPDLTGINEHGGIRSAVSIAARQNDERMVKLLLDAGVDINPALPRVTATAQLELLQQFLVLQPHANAKALALESAVRQENPAAVDLLLRQGVSRSARERAVVAAAGMLDPGLMQELLGELLLSPNIASHALAAALSQRSASEDEQARQRQQVVVRRLLEFKADPLCEVPNQRLTALCSAIYFELPDILELFLQTGVDLNQIRPHVNGETPLKMAIYFQHFKMVKRCLEFGADPTLSGNVTSPLELAVDMGSLPVVDLLLDAGANLQECRGGYTLLSRANSVEMLHHLIATGVQVNGGDNPILCCPWVQQTNFDRRRLLLEAGADPQCVDDQGVTPLMAAAALDHLEWSHTLMAAGVSTTTRDSLGRRAIDHAVPRGHSRIVKLLQGATSTPMASAGTNVDAPA